MVVRELFINRGKTFESIFGEGLNNSNLCKDWLKEINNRIRWIMISF